MSNITALQVIFRNLHDILSDDLNEILIHARPTSDGGGVVDIYCPTRVHGLEIAEHLNGWVIPGHVNDTYSAEAPFLQHGADGENQWIVHMAFTAEELANVK